MVHTGQTFALSPGCKDLPRTRTWAEAGWGVWRARTKMKEEVRTAKGGRGASALRKVTAVRTRQDE